MCIKVILINYNQLFFLIPSKYGYINSNENWIDKNYLLNTIPLIRMYQIIYIFNKYLIKFKNVSLHLQVQKKLNINIYKYLFFISGMDGK